MGRSESAGANPNGVVHGRGEKRARASLEATLGFRVGQAHRSLREVWQQRSADLGVSPPQATMLRAICERPGSGIRELARWLRTDPMNAKRLADHLEEAGLVISAGDASDRRRRELVPTDAGLRLADEVARRAERWNRQLKTLLGAAEFEELERLCARVEDVLAAEGGRVRGPRRTAARSTGELR